MTIKLALSAAFVAAFSLVAGGCLYYPSSHSDARTGSDYVPPSTSTTLNQVGQAEMLQGSLGNVASFSAASPELRITGSTTYANVRIDALNTAERWWAMNSLTISGGLNHAALRVGAHLTFTSSTPSTSGLRVSALGCSGPARNNYTYDHTAQSVTVDVLPGSEEGRNRMVFTAVYVNGSQTQQVQGSFEYDPR
jgi:hypothetical protein